MENSVEKPITNVDDLPRQIAVLREALKNSELGKAKLESQLETLLQVFQKLDFPKLLETIDRRLETSEKKFAAAEKTLREELTGRMAANIEPYIEKTVRRVNDLNENISAFETKLSSHRQTLEERFALHQDTVASEGDKLVGRLIKNGGQLINDWHNAQKTVQANLNNVNNYVTKIHSDLGGLQAAQKRVEDAGNMFAHKVNFWSQATESIEKRNSDSFETLRLEHEKSSLKIRSFGDKTTKNYKSMVFVYTIASCIALFISTAVFWGLTYNRANSEIGAIKEFTSQERQQIGQIFEDSVKNANTRNFSDEVDLRTFDFLISKMPPQLKSAFDDEIKRNIEEVKKEREAKNTQQAQVALQEAQKRSEK
jgi:hypothetical protein